MRRQLQHARVSVRVRDVIVALGIAGVVVTTVLGVWTPGAAQEAAEIAAVLRARQQALGERDQSAFLRFADPCPDWRRFLAATEERRSDPVGSVGVLAIERIGELRRVRAQIGGTERIYVFRRFGGRWVTSEPTAAELGPWAQRQAGLFRIHYHPRWEDDEVVTQVLAIGEEVALAVALHVTMRPEPVDIFLHHRVADRQALGWDVITHRAASRQREVHLWSPNSYGWGARAAGAALLRDLRQALAVELLFILPGL